MYIMRIALILGLIIISQTGCQTMGALASGIGKGLSNQPPPPQITTGTQYCTSTPGYGYGSPSIVTCR